MNIIKCLYISTYLWISSLLSRSEMGKSESSTGTGGALGSDTVENNDPVDLAWDKPRGEQPAKLTADLLSFIGPFLFWDSSMRRGTRGGRGGGLSKNHIWLILFHF